MPNKNQSAEPSSDSLPIRSRSLPPYLPSLLRSLVLLGAGAGIGLLASSHISQLHSTSSLPDGALRLTGYELISPLLVCSTNFQTNSPVLSSLQQQIENVINKGKQDGSITQAAVYFRDLKTGSELNINGDEKFFPASLKKLPLMMQYYQEAESDPSLLTTKRPLTGSVDYNAGAAIAPKEVPQYGQSYSAQELINYMIKYSDNISFEVLYPSLGQDKFDQIYKQMQLHYPDAYASVDATGDYATPYQFSLFFRALYNATYLNAADSERALNLLSQTDFKQGLVAGVPTGTTVAHKFGISAVNQPSGPPQGELHDCGIVYDKKNPYLICVMTKSNSQITQVENTISAISAVAYKAADSNYR